MKNTATASYRADIRAEGAADASCTLDEYRADLDFERTERLRRQRAAYLATLVDPFAAQCDCCGNEICDGGSR